MLRNSGWSPFLGKVPMLGQDLGRVPKFEIKVKNAGITKTLTAAFDTGLEDFDLELPFSVASDLGILPSGTEESSDYSQTFNSLVGVVDEVTVPSAPECSLTKAVVVYSTQFSQVMVGNSFLRAIGGQISYANGVPSIKCGNIPPGGQVLSPAFMMTFFHGQKVMDTDAYFDTGFDADLCLPSSLASQMGLAIYDFQDYKTHTGTVSLGKAKMDRMTMKDLPACWAAGVEVSVSPPSAPLQDILVGEGFMKKVSGKIGYDQAGAFFSCKAASSSVARAVAYTHLPKGWIPSLGTPLLLSLALGAVGLVFLGVVGYHLIDDSSE